jgi:hypothetical protein
MAKVKPGFTNVTVTLADRLARELRVFAADRQWSQGDIVSAALERYFRHPPDPPASPPAAGPTERP